tara:strand:- start:174 stop:407 length:234 start_codon:yes stop_codon:yes gene_type:complete
MEEDYTKKQATIRGKSLKRLEDILLRWRSVIMVSNLKQYKGDVRFIETFLNRRGFEIRSTLTEAIWKRMNEGKDLKE